MSDDDYFHTYPNRTICDILEDMRNCYKTLNFGALGGLIEEMQARGNRLEAALGDKKDVKDWLEKRSKLKSDINNLMQKKAKLKKECGIKKK